jgi:hypothetical protein
MAAQFGARKRRSGYPVAAGEASMNSVRLAVVIPVGPEPGLDNVIDTLESVCHYTTPKRKIVLVDDSGAGTGAQLHRIFREVDVVDTGGPSGARGGLFCGLAAGFNHVLRNYSFDLLLRMDTDALIIGPEPETEAAALFRSRPELGMLGSYRVDCNGGIRDFTPARELFRRELSWSAVRHFRRWRTLRRTLRKARARGYELGEHCLGGAFFLSYECVLRMSQTGVFGRKELRNSRLSEDHLFGLFTRSVGLEIGDLATGNLPLGVSYRGLPCSPVELLQRRKKITHSTRFWQDMREPEIRELFRKARQESGVVPDKSVH